MYHEKTQVLIYIIISTATHDEVMVYEYPTTTGEKRVVVTFSTKPDTDYKDLIPDNADIFDIIVSLGSSLIFIKKTFLTL